MYTQMNSPDYDSYSGKTRSFDRSLWLTNAWITFWKKISIDLMIWSSKQDYNQQIRRDVEVIFFSLVKICPFSFSLVWRGVWSRSVCVSADCCGWDLRYKWLRNFHSMNISSVLGTICQPIFLFFLICLETNGEKAKFCSGLKKNDVRQYCISVTQRFITKKHIFEGFFGWVHS